MSLPALEVLEKKLERQKRLFELKKGALERQIERHIAQFELKKGAFEKKFEQHFENHKKRFGQRFESAKAEDRELKSVASRKRRVSASTTKYASSAAGSRNRWRSEQ